MRGMNATTLSTDFPKSTISQESNYLLKLVYQDNNISCPLLHFGDSTDIQNGCPPIEGKEEEF